MYCTNVHEKKSSVSRNSKHNGFIKDQEASGRIYRGYLGAEKPKKCKNQIVSTYILIILKWKELKKYFF